MSLPSWSCATLALTPGQNQKHYLAGALDLAAGALYHCLRPCKTNALFQDLLGDLDPRYPAERYTRLSVVVDNHEIHKAKAVEQWLATHPRVTLLFLPTYCALFADLLSPCQPD